VNREKISCNRMSSRERRGTGGCPDTGRARSAGTERVRRKRNDISSTALRSERKEGELDIKVSQGTTPSALCAYDERLGDPRFKDGQKQEESYKARVSDDGATREKKETKKKGGENRIKVNQKRSQRNSEVCSF